MIVSKVALPTIFEHSSNTFLTPIPYAPLAPIVYGLSDSGGLKFEVKASIAALEKENIPLFLDKKGLKKG